ncbi:hypothetical protein [Nitrosomonas supralitoralis]|uniref:Uncharacterized protein n=1 Tax=Nitrosomonas supralitoralis TaxID=2116706 RepID=A0A2P7NVC8_9PROT|nr:hypothetical protein [Nitrosomonas supralitoralis]PSJ17398.1 hypothetical protein C7H79_08375 [Nitrosomonas supralitoralis]
MVFQQRHTYVKEMKWLHPDFRYYRNVKQSVKAGRMVGVHVNESGYFDQELRVRPFIFLMKQKYYAAKL